MTDPNELSQVLLAAVPEDGSSIGNQALMDTLKAQFSDLTDEAFTAAREALLELGVLRKGRVRGGAPGVGRRGRHGCTAQNESQWQG